MKKNKMSRVSFVKVSGAGNNFIILDAREKKSLVKKISGVKRKALAKRLCASHSGIGADGLIVLEKPKKSQNNFKWDFYNGDGSRAEMCMNASRCVTLYEALRKNKKHILFETECGRVLGQYLGAKIRVYIPITISKIKKMRVRAGNKIIVGHYINTGVPHFVVHKNKININNLIEISQKLRNHSKFGRVGANISYYNKEHGITYERGVEGFTQACGTGAAAIAAVKTRGITGKTVKIKMPGGQLEVKILKDGITQTGPAKIICSGQFNLREFV